MQETQRCLNLSVPQAPWPLPAVEGDQDLLSLVRAIAKRLGGQVIYGVPDANGYQIQVSRLL